MCGNAAWRAQCTCEQHLVRRDCHGNLREGSGVGGDETAEKAKAGLAKMQSIPRAGLPDDIGHAALFLASDESAFINGHDLVVDGGLIGGRQWSSLQEALGHLRAAFAGAGD
jgi:NAD(P)-dependent dehydrogenase (short-subunit alcohol dehydrogenase family)